MTKRLSRSGRDLPQADLKIESTNTRTRSCGACTACCAALLINELKLENGVPCPHQRRGTKAARRGGCSIYTAGRPGECQTYRCQWLDGLFERRDRPDRLGLIVDEGDGRIDYLEKTLGHRPVTAREASPGAAHGKRFKAALRALSNRVVTFYVPFGYRGDNPDVRGPSTKLVGKAHDVLATLDAALYLTWEHEQGEHTEPVEGCSVCAGICVCHPNEFLPVCTVCQRVLRSALARHENTEEKNG